MFLLPAGCTLRADNAAVTLPGASYAEREDVQQFISEMVEEGFEAEMLQSTFVAARYQQSIIDAISRPAERTLNWDRYQDIFLTERRVKAGVEFIDTHRDAFEAAEVKYGVPIPVIASIIGVETLYGRITGKYRVIDSLSTLAFDYPPRSKFFRSELKEFFRLAREEGQSVLEPLGSYAGAMGYGQFISSSYRNYAVDFDGDGIRDIWNNPVDAIGSVANYLSRHGWQRGGLVTVPARLDREVMDDVFNVALKPNRTVADLSTLGVQTDILLEGSFEVSPMMLEGKAGQEYWLGLKNFYVITRYNHSKLYAMAVFQLSEQIKQSLAS
ncbi:MAG: membrane-bound lytic murein transglycosylase B [Candidatus Azotimanducaceae bacterium]|jgi:membrane-bound lytic murein transglycosylase B